MYLRAILGGIEQGQIQIKALKLSSLLLKLLETRRSNLTILSAEARLRVSNYFPKHHPGNTAMERPPFLGSLPFKSV